MTLRINFAESRVLLRPTKPRRCSSSHTTERLRIKASVAADTVRTWQPNGYQPPEPDPELQALIDGAGVAEEDPDDADPADETK